MTRYGRIEAEGTAANPIIFTSRYDELDGNLSYEDRGLWGGIIILGQARTNNKTDNGLERLRVLRDVIPDEEDEIKVVYGGKHDTHYSGTLRYVSIRHGGRIVPGDIINDIPGLTLAAVGSETIVEYVEVFASSSDSFAFLGGTVHTKYLVSAFCSDDSFDWDEGYRGKGQFWFSLHSNDQTGRVGEHDGER